MQIITFFWINWTNGAQTMIKQDRLNGGKEISCDKCICQISITDDSFPFFWQRIETIYLIQMLVLIDLILEFIHIQWAT